ncbi:MAG TPA: peptidylprolyl isomerase, partial [Gemmataceae bacterium]|nr:peptidylprolyl isomerase [Gemmataceae bacterium]
MREWLAKLTPAPWLSKKLLMAAVLVGVGIGAYCWGRHYANANQPNGRNGQGDSAIPKGYGTRIVAYVYNQPVFREELGEYLIARMGAERLDFMINRKIVEAECRKQNVIVTDADVETRFIRDIASFGPGMSVVAFEQNVLRRFGKTVYEWKEDVIRPKLQMEELVRRKVTITEKDVKEGFEARYGPKVECRMIVFDKDDRSTADRVWKEISKGRDAFIARAKTQALPNLASIEGRVPPIHKHFGDQNIEDAAFRLKPGEVSGLIKMADHNMVVLLCESHIPPT